MMLKFLTFGAIALLLLLRLARTRAGARLLGVSQRVLGTVLLIALVIAGVLAVVFEQWILLAVVVLLLLLSAAEHLRDRGRAARSPRSRR